MVRSVSGSPQTPQSIEHKPAEAKAKVGQAKGALGGPAVSDNFSDGVPAAALAELSAAASALPGARELSDNAGLGQTLSLLESFANAVTPQVKGKPMAQDIMPSSNPAASPRVPMAIVSRALDVQKQAQQGKIVLGEQSREIVSSLVRAAAAQMTATTERTQLETTAQITGLQEFVSQARAAFASSPTRRKSTQEKTTSSAGAPAASTQDDTELKADSPTLVALQQAWQPVSASIGSGVDIDELAEVVMMQCANEQEGDLKDIMNDMQNTTAQKNMLRQRMTAIKEARAKIEAQVRDEYNQRTGLPPTDGLAIDASKTSIDDYEKDRVIFSNSAALANDPANSTPSLALSPKVNLYGSGPATTEMAGIDKPSKDLKATTLADFDATVQTIQDKSDSLGDMSQQMQIKLQLALDRRSKIYETLSAIMKKSSTTSDAIIQNLK